MYYYPRLKRLYNTAYLQKVGLDEFCTEVKVLNQLVSDAARATTVDGRLVSTAKKAALTSHATRLKNTPSK